MNKKLLITPIVAISLGAGAFYLLNTQANFVKDFRGSNTEEIPNQFVVQISKDDISERDIIELIGVNSLLGIKNNYYQLLLSDTQYETIISENIIHKKIPLASPQAINGMSIYSVSIKEPVINSKVQELANYGSIIENTSKNKYTIWTDQPNIESIHELVIIDQTAPFYLHERIDSSLIAKIDMSEDVNAVMKVVLPNDDTLEKIMNAVVKQGGQNVTQYKADIISRSLDSLNLEVVIPANKIYKLLLDNPEIVIIRAK